MGSGGCAAANWGWAASTRACSVFIREFLFCNRSRRETQLEDTGLRRRRKKCWPDSSWHCGEALEAVKRSRRHGEWLPWLASVGIAERTAQRCMRLRRQFPQIRQLDGFAGVGAALKALPVGEKKAEALLHAEKHFRRALEACRGRSRQEEEDRHATT